MTKKRWILIVALLLCLSSSLPVLSQVGGGYDLTWWTVDGGGLLGLGGGCSLHGTIGQADADTLSGGEYTLAGGFWGGSAPPAPPANRVFLPVSTHGF